MMKNLMVVSMVEGVRRVAVPHGTAVPANWPEPWAAQCSDTGEWWDNYDNPPVDIENILGNLF